MANGRVRITEVAAQAGVSKATVSLVLNGRTHDVGISAATCALVLNAAERLGYTPHHAARSLRRRQAMRLTLLVHNLGNPYYADIATAARRAAGARGYEVHVVEAASTQVEGQVLAHLRGGGSDGVIVATTRHGCDRATTPLLSELARQELPVVLLIDHSPDPAIPAVRIDDEQGSYLATTHLLRLGHRRIGYLAGATDQPLEAAPVSHVADRYRGYRRALTEAGVVFEPVWLVQGPVTMAASRELIRHFLELGDTRPTAVFCFNDQMAIGALRGLYDAGVRVPDDLALVGFDGLDLGAYTTPSLTTVAHSRARLGQLGVELLLDTLNGAPPVVPERVLPVELVVRESCGAVARGQLEEGRQGHTTGTSYTRESLP